MTAFSRRKFLSRSALAGGVLAAGAFPFVRAVRANETAPSDKIRLGVIGCGGMGQVNLTDFVSQGDVEGLVICDLDDARIKKGLEICQKAGRKEPDTTKDFRRVLERKDLDAVMIATPDHWHALPTVLACQAGLDVYVEKPLGRTIDEGRAMLEAARRHNRVVQMGSQWRSCKHILEATDLIKAGKLGKVSICRAWAYLDWLPTVGKKPDGPAPAGIDYDLWLGPAPSRPFNPNRFHFNFRWFWDYAGGLMTDWGVHLINIAQMGMGLDAPKSVSSVGGKFVFDDDSETPDSQVTVYEFPTYQMLWEHRAGLNNGLNGRAWGIQWTGTEGTIILNDQGYEIIPERKKESLDPEKKPGSGNPHLAHVRNFLDCVKSRQQPVLNLEPAHHVSNLAHLGNIAYRTGRKIVWDAANEKVVGDAAADALVGEPYRAPWKLPYARRHA
jgi:predicted dehydrogenase